MKNLTRKGSFISIRIGRAIADFNLIEDGDRIIIGVSGGKDSLALLKLLLERRRWAPIKFDILAVHVLMDRPDREAAKEKLEKIFKGWGCPYKFTGIKLKEEKNGGASCFWCSWTRRKALFNLASELGYNKIALGHHKDDIIETTLMNLFYKGEISSINPSQPLFGGEVTIIRPLVYVEEEAITSYAKEAYLPRHLSRCPNSIRSKRALIKKLIASLSSKDSSRIKSNIFKAPMRIKHDYLGKYNTKINN